MADEGPTFRWIQRGRVRDIPGVHARRIAANVWEVRVPKSPAVERVVRGRLDVSTFDESVVELGGVESLQVLGSGETEAWVTLTVILP